MKTVGYILVVLVLSPFIICAALAFAGTYAVVVLLSKVADNLPI